MVNELPKIFLYTTCFPCCFRQTAQWVSVICDSCQEGPCSWNAAQNAIHSTRIISSYSQEGYTDLGAVQTQELTQQVIYSLESPRKTCVQGLRRSLILFQRSIIGHQCLQTTVKSFSKNCLFFSAKFGTNQIHSSGEQLNYQPIKSE